MKNYPMNVPAFFAFVSFICLSGLNPAHSQSSQPDTIPFVLTEYNNLVFRSLLNDTDTLDLMLHTAAAGLTLTTEATAKMKSLVFSSADSVTSWGGDHVARYSPSNTLQIGGQKWTDRELWENEHSGRLTDGKFGLHLFSDKIVEVNVDNGYVVLHTSLPEKAATYDALSLQVQKGVFLFVEGEMNIGETTVSQSFLIHSGYGGSLLLDDEFVAANDLATQLPITDESILKDSYGNELKTLKATLPSFQLGTHELREVPVGFFEGAIGRQKMSVLGGGILRRFNLIFDVAGEKLYVQGLKQQQNAGTD